MQRFTVLLMLCGAASADKITPVQKVIQMMTDMKTKGTKEMEAEKVQFGQFSKFCEQTLIDKGRAIKEASGKIGLLGADIEKAKADVSRLTGEIAVHTKDAESAKTQQQQASDLRAKEDKDYQTTRKDYMESIDAIGRAIQVVKDKSKDKEQKKATALLQLSEETSPAEATQVLSAFMEEDSDDAAIPTGPPAAKAYSGSSGGIVNMLETLQDKFVDERDALDKAETKKKNAFDLLMQGLKSQETQATKEKQEKTLFRTQRQQDQADAEGALAETKKQKADDTQYSSDLQATCQKKTTDFGMRQKLRGAELEALQKAIDIISGGSVKGAADKNLPKLIQDDSNALAYLRSKTFSPRFNKAVEFLQAEGDALHSKLLSALVLRIKSTDGELDKVKKMIEQLIIQLNEDANAEATKKAFCDKELAENTATRTEKTDQCDQTKSELDKNNADITQLTNDIQKLNAEVVALDGAMTNSTAMREAEKKKNKVTIQEAVDAQASVAQAITVLKDFYEKAGEATALVQSDSDDSDDQPIPQAFDDKPYQGMGGSSTGVLGMLDVIQSDFARLEAQTTAGEAAATQEYNKFMEDSKVSKAMKKQEIANKKQKVQEKTGAVTQLQSDLAGSQAELDSANKYYEKLKPDCVDTGNDYEQRKARREKVIADLDNAVQILMSQSSSESAKNFA